MNDTMHWTSSSLEAFIQRITFDFLAQIEKALEALPMSQTELAHKLNVSEGAVSQVLNNPRNLTLKTIVKYARALGLKVAIVAYDDKDPDNIEGPVGSEIFNLCWERANRPTDIWSLESVKTPESIAASNEYITMPMGQGAYIMPKRASASTNAPANIPVKCLEDILSKGQGKIETAINEGPINHAIEREFESYQNLSDSNDWQMYTPVTLCSGNADFPYLQKLLNAPITAEDSNE